ncbi:TCR/Tet family MFS transporter [Hymenobacter chitinivorans]|uniref:DHA1 family tetracycline resistance protein-like MFS transporter n=1 Tax=Hymenobacter chitinivorans DSM 11115 TaxID=1121954 RepID=A0A2M9BRY5_9BACT|nr:TCR/Tet family MFS transporter [Hymenobacter chitinivorans]PJJ60691.1 DHA1 family tetracycline resistance protein-like MFS transporter [Hymenobacter chitinivorans DSM 11115]
MSDKRQAALGFIFITLLLDVIGFGIIIPVIPKLISSLTGGTISDASRYGGWLMFAFASMQFLFSPVLGNLSDQYGRRPVLLFALLGFGLDYLFVAFAPTITWLFVGRIIAGITGASFTTASAYIADISTPEKRAQNFGMIGAAFGLGFIIGPVIGGVLGQFGPRVPFLVAAGLTMINWLYGFFILPESLDKEHRRPFNWRRANPIGSLRQLQKYPVILGMVGSLVLVYIAAHSTQSTWSYYTMYKFKWNEAWVGYSLGAIGTLTALVQGLLIRRLNPWLGAKRSVFLGLAFYALGFSLFAFAPKGWMMFVFLIPYCLGGIAGPALQGIMSGQVPRNEQGELQGALTSLISLTSIIGPPLMTNLFSFFTGPKAPVHFPGAAFLTGAVLTVISMLLAMKSLRHYVAPVAPAVQEPEAVASH